MTIPDHNVYACIAEVSAQLAKEGISKSRSNQQQGYKFRGIDEVLNALAPIMSKERLVILPRVQSRDVTERTTQKGGVLFYVVVKVEFDFVSAWDGSTHTVVTFGEAMDSADKATNKAMSAAYKYAAIQTFCIPTEGDNDADATTHQVVPQAPRHTASVTPASPAGPAKVDGRLYVRNVDSRPTRKAGVTRYDVMLSTGESCATVSDKLGALADEACKKEQPIVVKTKSSQFGTDLVDLKTIPPMPQALMDEPPPFIDTDEPPF